MLIHFRHKPVLWFATFGIIFGFLGLLLAAISIVSFLHGDRSIVYPTTSLLLLFLFGSLLSWGLLAEFFVNIETRK